MRIDAVPAAREALAGDTVAAIGLTTSEHAMIAAPLLQGTSYTVISPYASAHSLLPYRPNILLMDDPTTVEAQAIAQFVDSELRPTKPLAIVAWDSAYSKDLYAALPERLRRQFHLVKVLNDSKQLQPIITQVLQYQPDLIFLPVFGVFAGHLIRVIVAGGYHGVFVGGQSWGETNGKAFQLITQGVEFRGYEIRIPSRYFPTPRHQQFAARFEREFPMTFSPLVANLYDGLHFLFSRINTQTTPPTRRTVQALIKRERSFIGMMGKKCLFDEWCAPRTYSVVAVDGGGFRPYTQIVVERQNP